jgi:hypothetical protein
MTPNSRPASAADRAIPAAERLGLRRLLPWVVVVRCRRRRRRAGPSSASAGRRLIPVDRRHDEHGMRAHPCGRSVHPVVDLSECMVGVTGAGPVTERHGRKRRPAGICRPYSSTADSGRAGRSRRRRARVPAARSRPPERLGHLAGTSGRAGPPPTRAPRARSAWSLLRRRSRVRATDGQLHSMRTPAPARRVRGLCAVVRPRLDDATEFRAHRVERRIGEALTQPAFELFARQRDTALPRANVHRATSVLRSTAANWLPAARAAQWHRGVGLWVNRYSLMASRGSCAHGAA